jgi:hypothetical protein
LVSFLAMDLSICVKKSKQNNLSSQQGCPNRKDGRISKLEMYWLYCLL